MSKCKLKLTSVFLTIVLVLTLFPAYNSLAATRASGTCGSNLSWSLSDTGVLTISGSGNMTAWDNRDSVPWIEYRESIKSVVFSGSITSISNASFYGCKNLTSIRLPDSVTSIGGAAFQYCESLTSFIVPDNVTSLGTSTFEYCTSLKSITLSSKLTSIGQFCFGSCNSLTTVVVPDKVTKMWNYVFRDCTNLKTVTLPSGLTKLGYYAFENCNALTDIYYGGTRDKFIKFEGYSSINKSVNIHYGTSAPTFAITTHPSNYTGAVGSTASFKVTAQGSGLKYQWQTYSSGKWVNSSLSGYNTSTLSVPVIVSRNGYKFRCVVTDSNNRTIISNEATLSVTAPAALSITSQPTNYTGNIGSTATFKVTAQGTGLKYRWQTYSNGKWVNSSLTGYNTASLSVPIIASRNGYKFRCVITDAANRTATSNAVTLYAVVPTLSITSQPKDFSGTVGTTAVFRVTAQGFGLKYQWQTYKNGTWVNSSLPGYNTASLSVPVIASRNGYKFRCVVTDSNKKSVSSNAAVLRVI